MKNIPLLLGTIIGTVVLIVAAAFLFSKPQATPEAAIVDNTMLLENASNSFGNSESSITIVEFSDFQCPACKATVPIVRQLKADYSDSVQFVYRHFPLDSIHPNARFSAQAAEAAAMDNKFWEYHDLLFDNQEEWSDITDKNELLEKFTEYATQLDIDKETFLERIESEEVIGKVNADSELAQTIGVNSTPTFFVNGQQTAAPQLISTVESLKTQSN